MPTLLTGWSVDSASESALLTGSNFGLAPATALAETFSRAGRAVSAVTLTTQRGAYSAIKLVAGQVVTNLCFVTNSTAADTPTHAQVGLYSAAKARLAVSADLLTTAWAADTVITVPLATPYTVLADGTFYIGIAVVATAVPTLVGVAGHAVTNAVAPEISFGDTTAIATAVLPATATASAGRSQFYAYVT